MKKSHYFAAFVLAAALAVPATAGFAGGRDDTASFQGDETSPADRTIGLGGKPFIVEHKAADRGTLSERSTSENPLADRAATLGGQAFTAESAEGRHYHAVRQTSAEAAQAVGNPLAERAAALGGKTFTVEQSAPQPNQSFLALSK